jgi:hypothetical protein
MGEGSDWGAFEVVHARRDIGARYQLDPAQQAFGLEQEADRFFVAGERYTFGRGAFHRSTTNGLCITVITKRNQRAEKALVLAKLDAPPVHAFEADDTFETLPIIEEAINALSYSIAGQR